MLPGRPIERLTTPIPADLRPADPGLLTREEYLAKQNPKGKRHANDIWDQSVEEMNQLFHAPLLVYPARGDPDRWTVYRVLDYGEEDVVFERDYDLVAVLRGGVLYHVKGWGPQELPAYAKSHKDEDQRTTRDLPAVQVKYPAKYLKSTSASVQSRYPRVLRRTILAGEPIEIRAGASSTEDVVALNEAGQVVAHASNEWGATLLHVAREYRGRGLGKVLGRIWYELHPERRSGGYTHEGEQNALRMWAARVREFLARGWYSALVRQGDLSPQRVEQITAGLFRSASEPRIPERPTAFQKSQGVSLQDLLFMVDPGTSFTIYDRRFLEDPDPKYVYAHGFLRDASPVGTFFFKLDYAPAFAKLALATALQLARDDRRTKLYVGEGYGDMLELDKLGADFPVARKGDYVWLTKNVVPLADLGRLEARTRRDPYGQVAATLTEEAEGKRGQAWVETAAFPVTPSPSRTGGPRTRKTSARSP